MKARNKEKNQMKIWSPFSQYRLKEGKMGKNTEKQLLREVLERRRMTPWEGEQAEILMNILKESG